MAATKKTTTAPRKRAAAKPKVGGESIVVLETSIGEPLVIRANPGDEDVRNYVREQTRRYIAGEAGGPSGIPPFRIFNASRFSSEFGWLTGEKAAGTVDIADLLPT